MEMNDTRVIRAPKEVVWEHLNSAETLAAAIPGCEELTGSPEEGFAATVKAKVGPVRATFKGEVTLSDINPPESYTISGEGKGGVAGFAKGGATVHLADHAEGTELSYAVEAKVGGKLAQLGSRIVDGFARKMADEFFANFQEVIEGPRESSEDADGQAPADESAKPGLMKRMFGGGQDA